MSVRNAAEADAPGMNGVIWISGYSASGKTTVGRKVEAALVRVGLRAIFLDGDDLRSIFAGRWSYSREDRIELARVYFRLASHLASQGYTVVISAIAMYDDVRAWVRENVPNSLEVFLDVPEEERLRRDRATKKLYGKIGTTSPGYDPPDQSTLKVDNHGVEPDEAADRIVQAYLSGEAGHADYGRGSHWRSFYSADAAPGSPSPYAQSVEALLRSATRILEIGCGNGRDAAFFVSRGHDVTAIDRSQEAVEAAAGKASSGRLLVGTLPELKDQLGSNFDAAYSRFVLHAMPLAEEEALLDALPHVLVPGGRLFIECRSINDPMSRLGEVLSPTERIHGHYRRFIVLDELKARLVARGFCIDEEVESVGLAVHGEEDPVVIRIIARKADR